MVHYNRYNRYQELNELAQTTKSLIASNPTEYQNFLRSVAWTYKYSVSDQVLIHAQHPGSKAVAPIKTWNQQVDRWVNSGTKGIGLLRRDYSRGHQIAYVFAVEDTHPGTQHDRFYLWAYDAKYENKLISEVSKQFNLNNENLPLGETFHAAALNCCASGIDDTIKKFIADSVQQIAEIRCGLKPSITNIEYPQANLDAFEELLETVSKTANQLLRCIERTIKLEKKRSNEHEGNHLPRGERIPTAELHTAGRSVGAGQVRTASSSMDGRERQLDGSETPYERRLQSLFHGGGQESTTDGGRSSGESERTESRSQQSDRPDGLDSTHELSDQSGRGNREERISLHDLISERVGVENTPTFFMSNYLPTILSAGPKLLKAQLNTLSNSQLAEVLKQKYGTERREWFDEESEKWFGFEATEEGLLTWEGKENKLQYRIHWESVAERRKELALQSFVIKQELPSPPKQLLEIQSINPESEEQSSENISAEKDFNNIDEESIIDDVKLPYYDRNNEDKSLPFFSSTKDLHEILLTTPHLKASADEIRVYLECKPNKKELVNYIKNIFNNDYTELILSDGRRVGYKTYQNVLHVWEGSYLSRTSQAFYDWGIIAANYKGMRLLGKLRNPSSDVFSSTNQLSFIDAPELVSDEKSESPLWEEIIETVLCHGSGMETGKFRIYNQFQKGLQTSEIVNFLKHEYGWGGCVPIIAGTDISEQHDTKGITLSKELGSNESITLKWPTVAQRIKELIQQNKYLTAEEKEAYPAWLHQQESKFMESSPSTVSETTDKPIDPDISSLEILSEKAKTTNPLAPVYSPWGEVDHFQLIQPGIFQVSTPSHGGIMIASEKSSSVLSDVAQNIGFSWGGYQCYEEDCAATVAIQELIDRNLFPIPVNEYYKEGEYKSIIERNAQQFYPEYWESRTQLLSAEQPAEDIPAISSNTPAPNLDNPQLLKKAIELINDFCIAEYHEPADIDYSDLSYIEIGCLVTESTDHEIQSVANLKDYRIDTYVDHELIRKEKYTDLQDMIDNALSNLNFDDLVYLSDKEWELFEERVSETTAPLMEPHSELTTASDAAFAAQNLIPNETTVELDGRTFMVDRINYNAGTVNFQDITFLQNTGFPIFRTEPISTVRRYLETQPVEQKKEVVSKPKITAENFHITDAHLGEGGPKTKFVDNLHAIQLLKQLESEDRQANPDEQEILSRYVGWGGLSDAFDPSKDNWRKEYQDLKDTLTPAEYEAAKASTLNAHYTSPTIINAIYKTVGNMGFETGNILEPSCGVGNFFGMLPQQMQSSRLYGVELDSISGRIAKKLYPNANITVAGFETVSHPNFFDLAIGNVPFGQYQVNDKAYNKLGFNIHNYFFGATRS